MTWASDPPAVPGVYWWRWDGPPQVCEVLAMGAADAHTKRVPAGTLGAYWPGAESPDVPALAGGEWWGPLVPPGDGGAVVSDSDRGPATADGEPWKGV